MFSITTTDLVPLTVLLLPVNTSGEFDDYPIYKNIAEKYPEVLSIYKEACNIGWFGVCSTLLLETGSEELPYIILFGSKETDNTRWTSIIPVLEVVLNKFVSICSSLDTLHDIGVVIVPTTIEEGEKASDLITDYLYGLSRGRTIHVYLQSLY